MSPRVALPPALPPGAAPAPWSLRLAAGVLRAASRGLDRAAERLAAPAALSGEPDESLQLEYHAEAGAPEGALYVNGVLVGYVPGVARL